jgi:hypothetical protein
MQLHIGSKHLATDIAVALDVAGREHLVIVAKATWSIPDPGQRPRPLPPCPLVVTDDYFGDPGESPMRYGADMARFKARCDVIFDACAHSPDGRPVRELQAGFELGPLRKLLRVQGPRQWQSADRGKTFSLGPSGEFRSAPLHHGLAFGGTRWYQQGQQRLCETHEHNPSGLGFAGPQTKDQMHQQLAHQLEHPQQPVQQPGDAIAPVALSAIGRNWLPRRSLAGTYDEAWQRDVFPLLPLDFDEQFHQCAPGDQQMPYPQGGEAVRLINLLPGRPDVRFDLPGFKPRIGVLRSDTSQEAPAAHLDTLFFETEQRRFSAVWRASVPIRRGLQEFESCAVGGVDPELWAPGFSGMRSGCRGCDQTEPAVELP